MNFYAFDKVEIPKTNLKKKKNSVEMLRWNLCIDLGNIFTPENRKKNANICKRNCNKKNKFSDVKKKNQIWRIENHKC